MFDAPSRPPRTSATRTCTARTSSRRASGASCGASSTAGARIVVADDGLTLHHHGYTENLAHALLLAVEQPDAAAGKVFNVGDEEVLSVRQVVEIVAAALDHELEIVSMPYDLALPARPLLAQPLPTHRVLDLTRLKRDLGYRDVVPARRGARADRALARRAPARARRHGGDRAHRPVRLRRRGPARSTRGSRRVTRSRCRGRAVRARAGLRPRVQRPRRPPAEQGALRSMSRSRRARRARSPESASSTCRSRPPGPTRRRCSPTRAPR